MSDVEAQPANARVLEALCRKRGGAVTVEPNDAPTDPYWQCGSHPEIVERVWDQLGVGLPASSRRIACGTPVLVDPRSGVIVAVAYGTQYCLRVPPASLADALRAGCETTHRWTGESATDLAATFGEGWVFGAWSDREPAWCREAGVSDEPAPRAGA